MKEKIKVSGMHCTGCEMNIKMALTEKQGVKKVKADYQKGFVEVEFDERKIKLEEIKNVIKDTGYIPQ
jgi:copper chaperone